MPVCFGANAYSAVGDEKFPYVHAEETARDGYIVSAADRLSVVDAKTARTHILYISLDFIQRLTKLSPPTHKTGRSCVQIAIASEITETNSRTQQFI